jgi:hypothetical protein
MNNTTIKNKSPPFKLYLGTSFKQVWQWKFDKVIVDAQSNRVKKIEVYNYFSHNSIKRMLKYLQTKQFKYITDTTKFPRLYNIQLKQEGQHIIQQWKIIDVWENKYKFYYRVYYVRVLSHRGRPILIKIYWNESLKKDFYKLELTYKYYQWKYNLHFLDWLSALKSINEIIRKIENRFSPIGYDEDFSGQITLDSLIYQVMGNLWKSEINHISNIFDELTAQRK